MADDEFQRFFHINKETLRSLTTFLNPARRSYRGGREQICPTKMVAVAVCFFRMSNSIQTTEQFVWHDRKLLHSSY